MPGYDGRIWRAFHREGRATAERMIPRRAPVPDACRLVYGRRCDASDDVIMREAICQLRMTMLPIASTGAPPAASPLGLTHLTMLKATRMLLHKPYIAAGALRSQSGVPQSRRRGAPPPQCMGVLFLDNGLPIQRHSRDNMPDRLIAELKRGCMYFMQEWKPSDAG